jgi:hypothetical protein
MPKRRPKADQHRCAKHSHNYYDGDQGVGNPYLDGHHDGRYHEHDDGVVDWEDWERDAYEQGFADGQSDRARTA